MNYTVIAKEEAFFQMEELPETVRREMDDDTVVFAALDDAGNVLSCAVYSYRNVYRREAQLIWFYTLPEARFLGAAAGVFSFGEQELSARGIRMIRVYVQEPMEEAVSLYYFLTHAGYQPVSLGDHIMQYDASGVTGCLHLKQFDEPAGMTRGFADADQIRYYFRQDLDIPAGVRDRIRFLSDPPASIFYVQGNRLTGCIPVRWEKNGIFVMELYVAPEVKSKTVRLAMLSQLASMIEKKENCPAYVFLEAGDPRLADLYRKLFGKEKSDTRVQQYIRYL